MQNEDFEGMEILPFAEKVNRFLQEKGYPGRMFLPRQGQWYRRPELDHRYHLQPVPPVVYCKTNEMPRTGRKGDGYVHKSVQTGNAEL